jgi:hypothetical protein
MPDIDDRLIEKDLERIGNGINEILPRNLSGGAEESQE